MAFCVLCATAVSANAGPRVLDFPGAVLGDIDEDRRLPEPSGAVYHTVRGTLFVVGDEGDIGELSVDGELLNHRKLEMEYPADFEGVTWAAPTGMLYVIVEMADRILEVDPEDLTVEREFIVERTVGDETVIAEGGQGLEGITFVADTADPDGGTFYVVNQGFEDSDADDASAVLQLRLPLREKKDVLTASILRHMRLPVFNVAAAHYDTHSTELYLLGDGVLCRASMDGDIRETYHVPGDDPEGLAFDASGHMYLVHDSGGVVKAKMSELFRAP
ncbi:hypothetical protein HN371_28275 [Candidatus Poribacteria bacterium]|nr:hypothetical protein [Candidatus Poribacteria bacterium]MBT5531673.1 hypothetical protein [Candidatus Poribacteria bacterium]MBT5709863.1 hypothetical protein [Candidatus Poribacteria bacterium]MBT7098490.1 hypothetical protein [Candidatus Poribacteria bacterium]